MQTITRFSEVTVFDAMTAWEQWNLTEYSYKNDCLHSVRRNLAKDDSQLAAVAQYHLSYANDILAEPTLMPGPTGETNELYCAGRGVCALIVENNASWETAIAMFTSALIAGNSVIICCDDVQFNQMIESAVANALPAHLVHIVAYDAYQKLIQSDIRLVSFVGSDATQMAINRLLAQSKGAIIPLVAEVTSNETESLVNMDKLNLPHDPSLVLRYITERTRTINITAVGGNATLLELGEQH